jgi:uncharacterized membrane protein YfcA
MEFFGYLASVLVGFVLGLLGGGGSVLSIPILVYLFHIEAVQASAYSLFIVGATSLAGAIPKYRDHMVNVKTGILFGVPSIITIFITRRWIVPAIPATLHPFDSFVISKRLLLLGIFAVLMVLASVPMIRGRKEKKTLDGNFRIPLTILEGIVIGFLTGLVGAGGGFLIIPALVFLTRLTMKTASGTSLFIIAVNSLIGFTGDLATRQMNWPFLLTVTALAITGVHFGNVWAKRLSNEKLRKGFGWITLAMGCYILVREFFFS